MFNKPLQGLEWRQQSSLEPYTQKGGEKTRERKRVRESSYMLSKDPRETVTRWWTMMLPLCRTTSWLRCQGFPESLTHSIYWASIVEGLDTCQPYQAHAAWSCPLFSRTLFPEGAGWGRAGRPSPAEWRPARCWHAVLWWPCVVALGKRRAPGQRSCPPLSSGASPCHLVQCSSLPGSMLRKDKSSKW